MGAVIRGPFVTSIESTIKRGDLWAARSSRQGTPVELYLHAPSRPLSPHSWGSTDISRHLSRTVKTAYNQSKWAHRHRKIKNKRIYCRLKSPSQQRIYQHESNLLLFFSFFKILNLCLLSIFSPRKKNGKRENRTSAIGGRACNLFKKIGCGHGQYSDRWWTALCAHQSTQKSASISVLIH